MEKISSIFNGTTFGTHLIVDTEYKEDAMPEKKHDRVT